MRLTIKAKLISSFAVILILFAMAGYFAISSLGGSNERMRSFVDKPFAQVQRTGQFELMAVDGARMLARSIFVPADKTRLKLQKDFLANDAKFQALLKDYQVSLPAEEQSRAQPLADAWPRMVAAANSVFELTVKNDYNHASDLLTGDFGKAAGVVAKAVTAISERPSV